MAKYTSSGMVNGGLTASQACNRISVLSATSGTPVIGDVTTYMLATVAATPSTDFPITAGSGDSRLVTVAAKSGVAITNSGTAVYVAYDNGTNFFITTCTSQVLTSGGTVTIPSITQTIGPTT